MSLFTFLADLSGVRKQLVRIADCLERAYPPPVAAPVDITDEKDVTYASDEATARQAMLDRAHELGFKFDSEGNLIHPSDSQEDEEEPSTPIA